MPIIKNRLFQPIGVMLSDGTMLHLQSRQEGNVSAADLDSPQLKALISSGQLALRESDRQESAAAAPQESIPEPERPAAPQESISEPDLTAPPEPAPADEPEGSRPKGQKGFFGRKTRG